MSLFARFAPVFFIAFLGGVFYSSIFHVDGTLVAGIFLVGVSAFVSAWSARSTRMLVVALVFVGVSSGMYRFTVWNNVPSDKILEANIGVVHEYKGIISDEPDVREGNVHLTVRLSSIEEASSSRKVYGTVLVIAPRFPAFQYGDEIRLKGKVMHPEAFTEKDGRVFDYPSFLRSKGIRYQMLFPHMDVEARGKGNVVISGLLVVKAKFVSAIDHALPAPHSALLSGLLLGGKQSLGAEWLDRFRTAGIIHIIVLSGYNMTLVSEWLVVAFRRFGFYGSLSAGAVGVILFAIMTGGGATVLRAAIMAVLVLVAKATG